MKLKVHTNFATLTANMKKQTPEEFASLRNMLEIAVKRNEHFSVCVDGGFVVIPKNVLQQAVIEVSNV